MALVADLLVLVVALLHVYFLILEMFLWEKPLGLKTFSNTPERARDSAVLAANQGLYNGFLAAGLIWGVFYQWPLSALHIKTFFLGCVVLAGEQMDQRALDRGLPRRRVDLRTEQVGDIEHVAGALAEGCDMGRGDVEIEF